MFPEGTRHYEHGLLPFKKGAFNIAVCGHFPVVPVVISDYTPFYSKPGRYFHSKGHIIVQILKPISTDEVNLLEFIMKKFSNHNFQLSYDDVVTLCERVQKEMAEIYENISKDAEQIIQGRNSGK
jgi:lysophosphatidate acyltransferase